MPKTPAPKAPPRPVIAYYGGTFNPIHNGHLAVANAVLSNQLAQQVHFLPSFAPPFKHNDANLLPYETRSRFIDTAVSNISHLFLNDLEQSMPPNAQGVVTTANVIRALQKKHGNTQPIFWIAGQDALASLAQWAEPEFLIHNVHWLQAPRNHQPPVTAITLNNQSHPLHTTLINMPPVDISSSQIRSRQQNHESITDLIPSNLEGLIH